MEFTELLKDSFLFRGIDEKEFASLLEQHPPNILSYKRGDKVYSSEDEDRVGFILKGQCEIRRIKPDGSKTVLNCLNEGGSFGILSVFSNEEFPTQIFALRNSEILYFTSAQIKHFIKNNSHISTNLINFLVNRINFLNKKITTFSGTRVEDRLAAFLICQTERQGLGPFPFNCQKTAEEINAGRASVYRAISSLEDSGYISTDNKTITILDLEGLERITK